MRDKPKSRTAVKREKPPAKKPSAPLPAAEPNSICIECAKHSVLKKFVRKHGATGHECGICHRRDLIVSAPAKHNALSSLVRALVRFHYDEWSYNPHWGGEDRPELLLYAENPIVEHEAAPGFPRDLFDPPYLDYDKGITIYGGHYDGMPMPLDAIGTSSSPRYTEFASRLTKENCFEVEDEFAKLLVKLEHGINAALQSRGPAGSPRIRQLLVPSQTRRSGGGWSGRSRYPSRP